MGLKPNGQFQHQSFVWHLAKCKNSVPKFWRFRTDLGVGGGLHIPPVRTATVLTITMNTKKIKQVSSIKTHENKNKDHQQLYLKPKQKIFNPDYTVNRNYLRPAGPNSQ